MTCIGDFSHTPLTPLFNLTLWLSGFFQYPPGGSDSKSWYLDYLKDPVSDYIDHITGPSFSSGGAVKN